MDFLDSEAGEHFKKMLTQMSTMQEQINNNRFVGKVLDNNDPIKNGRCKIFIYNVHPIEMKDSIEELSWILPIELTDYKNGVAIPSMGELVNIEFENDNINYPKYTTKMHSKTAMSKLARNDYPNTVVLFEYGEYSFVLNRRTGELKFTLAGQAEIHIDKDGAITLDNHLAVAGNDLAKIISPPSTEDILAEANAEAQSKLALGKPITIRSSGKINLEAPEVELGAGQKNVGSYVEPSLNPLNGGGFNCLSHCPFVGLPHTGTKMKSYYSSALSTLEHKLEDVSDLDN